MSLAPAPRYIESLGIVLERERDRDHFEVLLDGSIVRVELEGPHGMRWVTSEEEPEVAGYAFETVLSLPVAGDDEDVEGHLYPGTYAPRFDLQTRDIATKVALQQALQEGRVRSFVLEDRDGGTLHLQLARVATEAVSSAVSFLGVRLGGAQSALATLKVRL